MVIENNTVVGIVTDGDIRRMLNNRDTFTGFNSAKDHDEKSKTSILAF